MANIPLSSLYLPTVAVYQTQAQAQAAGETVNWNPNVAPQFWKATLPAGYDPDAPFTIHNLAAGVNGAPTWGLSYIPNSQAVTLNIPPTPASGTNAPVYPASIPIPMVYPLPAGDIATATPFGLELSDGNAGQAAPAAGGADPTLVRVLNGVNALLGLDKLPPV